MNKRNSNIELLRIIALFGILLWHISIHGFDFRNIVNSDVDHVWVNALCTAIFVPCVDIFVLISGYFGIKLSLKPILHLEIQSLFYGYCKIIVLLLMGIGFGRADLFPTIGGTWWFVTCYMLLMLASPIINAGVQQLSNRQLLFIILAWNIINGLGSIVKNEINGSNFTSLFLIYITGAYIRRLYDAGRLNALKTRYLLSGGGNLHFVQLCSNDDFYKNGPQRTNHAIS